MQHDGWESLNDLYLFSPWRLSCLSPQGERQALLATLRPGIDGLLLHQYGRRALKQKGGWPAHYWYSSIR
ncbi:hypothetical protein [Shewanella salipaludis]|uniref:hypothetical protein n=1 Tax=Shewanella salipaludis TaxID=2723052 RepID=UPI001B7D1358|nr:hypothetical protein [Shewanella salipaludis]